MLAIKKENEDGRWKMEDGIRRTVNKCYPRSSILHARILWLLPLALAVFISGCSPSGSHALLNGKKFLDRGDYANAVAQLKIATSLLATNAQAWNYLGLAYHHDGQAADAVVAYQRALALDRDLAEAHYNLGCLWLEQNKPDAARTEFTAYTLRRSNAPEGWLKLGLAQLRVHDLTGAEKSFSTALYLNPNNAEALNGLGLAQIQHGRPREAAQDFSAAVKAHPDYAPAILNLATVAQEYLHDNKLALQYYRAYLALTPRPANWNEVNAIAAGLDQPVTVATAKPPPRPANESQKTAPPPPAASETRAQTTSVGHPAAAPGAQPVVRTYSNPPPPHPEPPAQVVTVQPEPAIVTTPGQSVAQAAPPVYAPPEPAPVEKPGIWHRLNPTHWFRSSAPQKKFDENGVTPLPPPGSDESVNPAPTSAPPVVQSKPVNVVHPAPAPAFPRYVYLSPHQPKPGDRRTASGLFTRAREFEQASRWLDAMKAYQQAAETDPAWFEAQYNFGVLSYRLRNFRPALAAYETALAIRPDSVDARYNFALALKAAGYVPDAVRELEKIVKASPNEARAHLALGNLYAQQLHDAAQARRHYLRVLALDPANPQTSDIQFWLSSNPP
ncbi:MAG TPA: tetratricopeptide repeat protein [Verrucomicrobiae bacterium]|nr:tetratricopeptide repeat protein [Verrucomicrobiae bacterium]